MRIHHHLTLVSLKVGLGNLPVSSDSPLLQLVQPEYGTAQLARTPEGDLHVQHVSCRVLVDGRASIAYSVDHVHTLLYLFSNFGRTLKE